MRRPEGNFEKSREEHEKDCALEIFEILARIVETGPELDPQVVRDLRAQVQSLLDQLGLKSTSDLMLQEIIARAYSKDTNIPTPEGYPPQPEFIDRYHQILKASHNDSESCNRDPVISELILHARDAERWTTVKGRHISTEEYLYGLGKVLSHRAAYQALFPDNDAIAVDRNWIVQNGRHRVLALKCLGPIYVAGSEMSGWIKPKLEK